MGRLFILLGFLLILVGLYVQFEIYKYLPLGRLPGDIRIEKESSVIYIPITTSLLVSLVFSLVLQLAKKYL